MITGRPPKPKAVKELEGNLGRREIPQDILKLPAGVPRPPARVKRDPAAMEAWEFYTGQLGAIPGLLAEVDRETLAALCLEVSRACAAADALEKHGVVFEEPIVKRVGENVQLLGYALKANPASSILDSAHKQIRAFSSELGLSPSARMRIKAPGAPAEDRFAEFLNAKGDSVQ